MWKFFSSFSRMLRCHKLYFMLLTYPPNCQKPSFILLWVESTGHIHIFVIPIGLKIHMLTMECQYWQPCKNVCMCGEFRIYVELSLIGKRGPIHNITGETQFHWQEDGTNPWYHSPPVHMCCMRTHTQWMWLDQGCQGHLYSLQSPSSKNRDKMSPVVQDDLALCGYIFCHPQSDQGSRFLDHWLGRAYYACRDPTIGRLSFRL